MYIFHFSSRTTSDGSNTTSKKIYADLDVVQSAMVSEAHATNVEGGGGHGACAGGVELQAEVIVPIVTPADVVSADPGSFMHWEYLDSNTVRTFEIPVQIGSTIGAPSILAAESYISSAALHDNYGVLPPGFHAHQQFPPYVGGPPPPVGAGAAGVSVAGAGTGNNGHAAPPPPPPPTSTSENNNHSILIQRVPHRQRKGRGNVLKFADFIFKQLFRSQQNIIF